MHHTNPEGGTSVLASLRSLIPNRHLHLSEALRIAELQAGRLLELRGALDVPVPTTVVTGLPRVSVEHDTELPTDAASGSSHWNWQRGSWIICLNPTEPRTRRRFTLFHEYKHILDHGSPGIAATPGRTTRQKPVEEIVADYFAGCVLMPKRLVKTAYFDGIQRTADLAELFDVSQAAVQVRLNQLGLLAFGLPRTAVRYTPRLGARRPYFRSASFRSAEKMEAMPV
ncbi:MAG: ImmA/IrrE family metallo-endopeptidase [Actinomycetota bacterium]|nr:ImmA/IrrE family metallo-endopeptidase [Actinomycetota bacterium]